MSRVLWSRSKTLFFSFSTADENLHAPDELMQIRRLREGIRAWEVLWRLLAGGQAGLRLSTVERRPECDHDPGQRAER
jgi:hypothetical protein